MPPRASRKREEPDEENAGGRPFWSGTLTFGLVSVPVSLFPAQRTVRTSLRMLGPDGQPLARKYFAEKTGKDLDADDVVREVAERIVRETTLLPVDEREAVRARDHVPRCEIAVHHEATVHGGKEIGRASCRERV